MGRPTSLLPFTYRSYYPPPPHSLPIETVRTVLGTLLLIGAVTGAYYWYSSIVQDPLSAWPAELREDLRKGIEARQREDWLACQHHLARAWFKLLKLPRESLDPELYLKTSGILVTIGDAFMRSGRSEAAYIMLEFAIEVANMQGVNSSNRLVEVACELLSVLAEDPTAQVEPSSSTPLEQQTTVSLPPCALPTKETRIRIVTIAMKLASLSKKVNLPAKIELHWLRFASYQAHEAIADELLARSLDRFLFVIQYCWLGNWKPQGDDIYIDILKIGDRDNSGGRADDGLGLPLPPWTSLRSIVTPQEKLGLYCVDNGDPKGALNAYGYCIALLDKYNSTDALSEYERLGTRIKIYNYYALVAFAHKLFAPNLLSSSGGPTMEDIDEAFTYARTAYDLTQRFVQESKLRYNIDAAKSERAGVNIPLAAYNLGLAYELKGEFDTAEKYFQEVLSMLQGYGSSKLRSLSRDGLARLQKHRVLKSGDVKAESATVTSTESSGDTG